MCKKLFFFFFWSKHIVLKIYTCKWVLCRRTVHRLKQPPNPVVACRFPRGLLELPGPAQTPLQSLWATKHGLCHNQWDSRLSGMQPALRLEGITPHSGAHSGADINDSKTWPLGSVLCGAQRVRTMLGASMWYATEIHWSNTRRRALFMIWL